MWQAGNLAELTQRATFYPLRNDEGTLLGGESRAAEAGTEVVVLQTTLSGERCLVKDQAGHDYAWVGTEWLREPAALGAFVKRIDTLDESPANEAADLVTLTDGRVLVISADLVALYEDADAVAGGEMFAAMAREPDASGWVPRTDAGLLGDLDLAPRPAEVESRMYPTRLELAREDLPAAGFDPAGASERQMERIALRLAKSESLMWAWWEALREAAAEEGLPQLESQEEQS